MTSVPRQALDVPTQTIGGETAPAYYPVEPGTIMMLFAGVAIAALCWHVYSPEEDGATEPTAEDVRAAYVDDDLTDDELEEAVGNIEEDCEKERVMER
jgi:hypothetical protein